MYKIIYSPGAIADLKKLDYQTGQRIINKIVFYSQQTDPLVFAKTLRNPKIGQYRFRIGNYRALFDLDQKGEIHILNILKIAHRKEVYE